MNCFNPDCVRALMLWLDDNSRIRSNGKAEAVKLKHVYPIFQDFTKPELYAAADYIVEKKLISINGDSSRQTARFYVCTGITAMGRDYIQAVRDETVWKKVKASLGSAALQSILNIIQFVRHIDFG